MVSVSRAAVSFPQPFICNRYMMEGFRIGRDDLGHNLQEEVEPQTLEEGRSPEEA